MRKIKILAVEDEVKILEIIKAYLQREGYEVITATNGKEAMKFFSQEEFSLAILDLMLPDITGEEICKLIRKKSDIPIIMLTAKVDEASIINGLSIGSDDYVTKPFSPKQLVARVNALIRRYESKFSTENILSYNNELFIDLNNLEVRKGDNLISLTATEFKLLTLLAKNPKRVFSREDLISYVLGDDFEGFDRTIDSHIKNLRQKVEDNTRKPRYILTVHGFGYKFGGEA
ncbi:response regulator transcription factor [Clostridium sp. UBA4548]|uniref:response regulator transcription factor n=1 Tax=Clostridium sp. UBA4548 TaxID=1946361 RepID=UPI0025C0BC23|nr:response regulator transcription factor [Clostridium sp. UBA4548]